MPYNPVSRGFYPNKRLINNIIHERGLLAIDSITTRLGIDIERVAVVIIVAIIGHGLVKPPRLTSCRPGTKLLIYYKLVPFII
jgi:hypothetical protein